MSKACCSTSNDEHKDTHDHNHEGHDHEHNNSKILLGASLAIFFAGIFVQYVLKPTWFVDNQTIRLIWFGISYIIVAFPVWGEAFKLAKKLDFFNEFSLMGIATLGAFIIGEYPEGVAVMLFYTIGEMFQEAAVNKAKGNIKALLDVRPDTAHVLRNGNFETIKPQDVVIGETIQVKVGEKVPLDGIMISDKGSFNTAALTGESKPSIYKTGETVLAGMLNLENVIEIQTTKKFEDSSIAKILQMVQDAASRKAPTELFIRKFAKIYTPIVFFLAAALVIIPYFFVDNYDFHDWLYRGLVFLVVSCPCALVISVPLGYFGGIGAASRNGILVKGSNFLDLMAKVNTVVMDKTGTMTEGVFEVQKIETNLPENDFLNLVSALEKQSTHPIAKAIVASHPSELKAIEVEEISGKGLKGKVDGKIVLAGNTKLLDHFSIQYPQEIHDIVESIVVVAVDNKYAGYITIADKIKEDAQQAIQKMKALGVSKTIMLSGDKNTITQKVAKEVGVDEAFGGLLPEGKVEKVEALKKDQNQVVAFVGDGINDAPVLALSDVGIAMGGLGSDAAIETADVVIQTDQPSKIATAIKIGRETKKIVIQNIILAMGVKIIVLFLGAEGIANMWEAVFADVGVALLAILNAVRIQRMKF
ncbi:MULTISPECIES: heavy metal translocating P-type ATPase [Empedobacter]|uniref:P-type Zn(2+) transporter n=1 Tax=Empedobacter falsenii TaxID=343874 RepID=A0A376G3J0_9FLAO|nr:MULTISPECIES: heavy metal translocating P-type ATPase [Empedobacter]MDM1040966.1 cadmium-translocating P-type ATPase [Empedobacter brevis]MDM1134547.1 cadmium-translocating P-type ATPase [Empedobacter sp. R750]STD53236.1 Zinc-transporting ATPase [Empedobacter falsenii]HAR72560.1 cadmium-translocating P-type ATPase [Flavobacteriaceae bacterium]